MDDTEIRARNAQQLLENPLLDEALTVLRGEAIDAWAGTKAAATEERERHWMMVKAADRLREYLKSAVDDGRFAANRAVRAPLP